MSRPWTVSPALKASAALHVGAALGTVAAPAIWPWALGAVALNHAVITGAGLLPRTSLLGPNLTRLPAAAQARRELALTIDDGPDPEVTPRVLDLLDAAGARASFFCIGWRARQSPALCREIVARGHRVENHGDSHSNAFSLFGPRRMRADVAAAQATLSDITGQAPLFFRPTAGLRNPFLEPVLASLDLQLAAWTRRPYDTRDGRPQQVLQRLTRGLGPGDILLMHDGHAALTPEGQPVILATLPLLLHRLKAESLQAVTLQQALA
ncbi:polysaccharide deacetylase family protein [Hydrogenophaga sp. SL48]|jgi:peptidoglycan/xylan/chitin deacetylase (PgdA/CDA1 family)|uniref:polysaccharide deacetylase family protein n=1 Tax=Hydrogenophaga sp. SL48 TaxID=2806347 RepID=UPI001F298126|nr:polysaccharide deacetylase family protein [Hydrogenophaga sp. SL48]UJW82177.1 polysaccharide deacetylase family protein [Hydrogenophaga sp. SL48]